MQYIYHSHNIQQNQLKMNTNTNYDTPLEIYHSSQDTEGTEGTEDTELERLLCVPIKGTEATRNLNDDLNTQEECPPTPAYPSLESQEETDSDSDSDSDSDDNEDDAVQRQEKVNPYRELYELYKEKNTTLTTENTSLTHSVLKIQKELEKLQKALDKKARLFRDIEKLVSTKKRRHSSHSSKRKHKKHKGKKKH